MSVERRQVLAALLGATACLLVAVVLSQYPALALALIGAYCFALGATVRRRWPWLLLLVPPLVAFVLSPGDALWLAALGLVSLPGAIALALGRALVGQRRGRAAA